MVTTHSERYGQDYWAAFDAGVAPHLPASPVVIDLGCGPGLFLRDLARRDPSMSLYGYDVTPAMIVYAQGLTWPGVTPTLVVHDVTAAPLPHAAGAVDLVSMTSVLHVLDEPLPVLAEIRRVLSPRGLFLLHDWIRQPFQSYLAWRRDGLGETGPEHLRRACHERAATEEPAPADPAHPRGAGRLPPPAPQGGVRDHRQGWIPPCRRDELRRQGRRLLHDLLRQGPEGAQRPSQPQGGADGRDRRLLRRAAGCDGARALRDHRGPRGGEGDVRVPGGGAGHRDPHAR